MTRCLNCIKLDIDRYPKHADVGFGHCHTMAVGSFVSFDRYICESFKQAPEEIVEKRVEFEKSLTKKER